MTYDKIGVPMPANPYDGGFGWTDKIMERKTCKRALLTMLNAKDEANAVAAVEAQISECVMTEFANANLPLLNIHDGARCRKQDGDKLRAAMTGYYTDMFAVPPSIK